MPQSKANISNDSELLSFYNNGDFKNVIFEKIHWAHFEVVEVKRSFSRSPRPNFGFHLVFTSFHLEFSSFWISRSFDLGDLGVLRMGPVNVFKNNIFDFTDFFLYRF